LFVARRLGSGGVFYGRFELLRDDVGQIEQTMIDIILLPQQPIPPKSCVAV
jgi:hypothetical protein